MLLGTIWVIVTLVIYTCIFAAGVYLFILLIKALKKYLNSADIRQEKAVILKTLGETIREERMRCKMTQEFVADSLGVSRQAVSKWENGSSDPSTANLLALAKLFDISAEELLKNTMVPKKED